MKNKFNFFFKKKYFFKMSSSFSSDTESDCEKCNFKKYSCCDKYNSTSTSRYTNKSSSFLTSNPTLDKDEFYPSGYNKEGFDREGFDHNGFDRNGYDKNGYDAAGFNSLGYNQKGYNSMGCDEYGYQMVDLYNSQS